MEALERASDDTELAAGRLVVSNTEPENGSQEAGCDGAGEDCPTIISIATGVLAAPHIRKLTEAFMERFPRRKVIVYPIENRFFGEMITVSGLLTGQDIIAQLKGRELGERLLLPCNLLRSQEQDFLDDITLEEAKKALQVPIDIVESNGQDLLDCLLGI